MTTKKDYDEDLIFTDRNGSTLEVYNDYLNTHDVTTGVDNNHNNYNSNDTAYKYGTNNKEEGKTYEDGSGANTTHKDGARYTYTPATDNPPDNYEHDTMDKNAVYEILGMGATEETEIMDAIED